MATYLITRHRTAAEWILEQGVLVDRVLTHIDNVEHLSTGDVVIGILPLNLIARLNAKGVRYIHLDIKVPAELRGQELSIEQLRDLDVQLIEYIVKRVPVS